MKTKKLIRTIVLGILLLSIVSISFGEQLLMDWRFEEGIGNIIIDYSPNGYNGQISGAKYDTTSKFGDYALKFDGKNDYAVSSYNHEMPGIVTISQWIMFDKDILNNLNPLFNIESPASYYTLEYVRDTGVIEFRYHDQNGTLQSVNIHYPISANNYYNIISTIDSINKNLYIWINKALVLNQSVPDLREIQDNDLYHFYLGVDAQNHFAEARIDEIKIFDFVPTANDIDDIYTHNFINITYEHNDTPIDLVGAQIINYTLPVYNSFVTNPVKFEYLLNTEAYCDLYLNNKLIKSFPKQIAGVYETTILQEDGHEYFLYCYYNINNTRIYELTQPIYFTIDYIPRTVEFFIDMSLINDTSNIMNLYLTTPCISKRRLSSKYYHDDTPIYIKQIENNYASFNLSYVNDYEFCILNGRINIDPNIDGYTTSYDIMDVVKNTELGTITVDEDTYNYYLKLKPDDIYNVYNPSYWQMSFKEFFKFMFAIVSGLIIIGLGIYLKNAKIVIAGVLLLLISLGISTINLITGVLF